MANTFNLIAKTTLTAPAATVTFSAIPQIYDDLFLVLSASTNYTSRGSVRVSFNGYTGNTPVAMNITGSGSTTNTIYNPGGSGDFYLYPGASDNQNAAPGSSDLYIPRYTSSSFFIPMLANTVVNSNSPSGNYLSVDGILYNYAVAKTSILLQLFSGANFLATSNFYLYGIKNT